MPITADEPRKAQVIEVLKQRYFPIMPEKPGANASQKEINRLSRSLAAFAIQKLASCSEIDSAHAVVDCGDDNGIDAIYYDRRQHTLWLVQSKYGDAPGRAENQTFCAGINDLLRENYDRFHLSSHNSEFERVQADVEDAFQATATKVIACVVYMGNPLGQPSIADLEKLKGEQNESKVWFDWRNIGLAVLHGWLTEEHAVVSLNVELILEQWNLLRIPRRAVYGLVKASQLALLYGRHGNALFEKNIRYYLGNQAVNTAIAQTVEQQPEELFFLNNGITVICSKFEYPGNNKESSRFTLNNCSIVNGAQTVGSIAGANQSGTIPDHAKLLVTIIEVGQGSTATDLGKRITSTRNTQNIVHRDNFAALDPNQERLRQELAISEITYHYRTSDHLTSTNNESQFSLEEATLALACCSGDTQTIVAAKKEIGQVKDREGSFYPKLFRDTLSGAQLYRQVQIFRYLNSLLSDAAHTEQGRRAMFFRHGGYFIIHIWARRNRSVLNKAEMILSDTDKLQLSNDILELAEQVYNIAEPMFGTSGNGYLKIFRTMADAEPLAKAVMRQLNQSNPN